MKKIRILLFSVFVVLITTALHAQVTTSGMSGRVTDADGAIIGATIVATHTPSGTNYGAVTNNEGRFNITGMRVGGPYRVEVSYIGYGKNTTNNITLSLGENYSLNVVLSEGTQMLDEVVATATRTKFATEKTGAATNINNAQIANFPTVNRPHIALSLHIHARPVMRFQ